MNELINVSGVGKVKTRQIIAAMAHQGRMEVFVGSQINSAGSASKQVWYRPIKK